MSLLVDELAARLYWQRMSAVPPDVAQWYGAPFRGYAFGAVSEVLTGTWQLRPAIFATVRLLMYDGQLAGDAQSAVCAIRLRRPLPVVEMLVPPVGPLSRTDTLPHLDGFGSGLEVRAADPAAATPVLAAVARYLAGCEGGWYCRTSGIDLLSWWPVCELQSGGFPPTYQPVPAPPVTAATVQWRLDRLCHLAELLSV